MRISEILNGSGAFSSTFVIEGDTSNAATEALKSVILPLKSQKVNKVTVDQLIDNIKMNPQLEGIDIDQSYIVDVLGRSKAVDKIQADPENNGLMTVYFDFPVGDRQIDAHAAEKEKQGIKKAALNQIKGKIK